MNPARPKAGEEVAKFADVPDPGVLVVTRKSQGAYFSMLIARRDGAVFAYENVCPHAGYPLHRTDGRVLVQEGRYLVCGAHGASFALETGACAGGPCNGEGLTRLAVEVRDGAVLMRRPDPCSDRGDGAS